MKPMRFSILLVLAVSLGVFGCKKTEKGESKRWDRGTATISELSANYPNFKTALEEQRRSAEMAMSSAEKVEDKKKRIDAMSKANNLLSGGFVGELSSVDGRIKAIRKDLVAAAGEGSTPEEQKLFEAAKLQVEKSLSGVEATLKAGASDTATASAVLKKVDSELKFAAETLAQVTEKVGERKQEEAQAAAEEKASEEAAAQEAAEKVAPWTCEYCSHENPHDATECGNCKAARPAK